MYIMLLQVRYLVRKLKASFPYRKDIDYSKLITKKSVSEENADLDSEPDDIESDDDEVSFSMWELAEQVCDMFDAK